MTQDFYDTPNGELFTAIRSQEFLAMTELLERKDAAGNFAVDPLAAGPGGYTPMHFIGAMHPPLAAVLEHFMTEVERTRGSDALYQALTKKSQLEHRGDDSGVMPASDGEATPVQAVMMKRKNAPTLREVGEVLVMMEAKITELEKQRGISKPAYRSRLLAGGVNTTLDIAPGSGAKFRF